MTIDSHIWSILDRQNGAELGTYNLQVAVSEQALHRIVQGWGDMVVLWNHTTGEVFYR